MVSLTITDPACLLPRRVNSTAVSASSTVHYTCDSCWLGTASSSRQAYGEGISFLPIGVPQTKFDTRPQSVVRSPRFMPTGYLSSYSINRFIVFNANHEFVGKKTYINKRTHQSAIFMGDQHLAREAREQRGTSL